MVLHLQGAINKAEEEIMEETVLLGPLFELASLYKGEESLILQYLTKIVDKGYFTVAHHIKSVEEKWLYLVLAWLYDNHQNYHILYAEQEHELTHMGEKLMIVADDFDNPDVIEELVDLAYSFDGTSLDTEYTNNLNTWQEYLKSQELRFK